MVVHKTEKQQQLQEALAAGELPKVTTPCCQPLYLVPMGPEHFSRVKHRLKCCIEQGHTAGRLRPCRVISQILLQFLWTYTGSYFLLLCCLPGLRNPILWQGCSLPAFSNPKKVWKALSAETDKSLKLNCNIKFWWELSHQWYFIVTFFYQVHCYCLISITSMNIHFIYIYANFQFLVSFSWVLEIALCTFPIAALPFLLGDLSIVGYIFIWIIFSVKILVTFYSHIISISAWCSHKAV